MNVITVGADQHQIIPLIWDGIRDQNQTLEVVLSGTGAQVSVLGALMGQGSGQFQQNIIITHAAPSTVSRTLIKGVLRDRAQIHFQGLVRINKGAKKSDAHMASHILLLSPATKAKAIPSLEIDENEVKCGHAATVGQIDPEQLFYLESRGVTHQQAVYLIVNGFLQDVASILPAVNKPAVDRLLRGDDY